MSYIFLMLLATLVASSSVIAIKLSTLDPTVLAATRLVVATLALLPSFLWLARAHRSRWKFSDMWLSVPAGVFLAVHFISWNLGARLTIASNASLLVNFVPLAMPILLWFIAREALSRREVVGTVVALVGVGILLVADYQLNRQYFLGDLVCLGSMLTYAAYLVFGRRHRNVPHLLLYLVPVYGVAALVSLGASLVMVPEALPEVMVPREFLLALYMGLGPTVVGHSLFNLCLKHLRGQQIGLLNQAQFLWATVMAWLILAEVPNWSFVPAALLLSAGAVVALGQRKGPPGKPFSGAESRDRS